MSTRETITIKNEEDRARIARWARNVEAGTVVTFRKKSRSTEQSAKMWAMLGEVSKQVDWFGQKLSADDWKDVFTASLRHARVVPGIDKGTYVPLGMRTSTMTIEEMSNLIELIYAFGAEQNVVFEDPKETNSVQPERDPQSQVDEAGATPPTAAPASPSSARDMLIRFARDILPKAADTNVPASTLSAIEKRWASDLSNLDDEDREKATQISKAMRAIANGKADLRTTQEFFAEVLECTLEEIGGAA